MLLTPSLNKDKLAVLTPREWASGTSIKEGVSVDMPVRVTRFDPLRRINLMYLFQERSDEVKQKKDKNV